MESLTDDEIAHLVPILRRAIADGAAREKLQSHGLDVLRMNMYSSTPSFREIDTSFEYGGEEPPYLDSSVFDDALLRATLARLREFSSEFSPPIEGDEVTAEKFYWNNSQFSYSDAMAYYCFMRALQPRTVVEIGSGFSTLVGREAMDRNGFGNIVCVEPFPRPFLEGCPRVEVVREPAQAITPERLNAWLGDGDFLFVDSTHTVKTGSDCLHIYLRLLPRVRRNVLVHSHDVFLPFGLPKAWLRDLQLFWTEQYLLLALLTDNPKTRVLYGSAYHDAFNPEALDQLMDGKRRRGGGSLWFEYNGGARE